jgi:nucleoside-diphosphate-sugar epimerase
VEPTWDYPKSKVETEKLLRRERGNIPVVSLRIAGVYDDLCQSIPLAHQIQRIYEKQLESHMYSGDTKVRQAFVHVDDLVSACDAVIQNADKLPGYSVFNIGEEDAMSYDEIQQAVGQLLYKENWTTLQIPKPIAKTGAWVENALPTKEKPFIKPWMIDRAGDNYELTIDKARSELGWQPAHTLRASLPKMVEGLEVDPLRWYEINKLKAPESVKEHQNGNGAHLVVKTPLSQMKK